MEIVEKLFRYKIVKDKIISKQAKNVLDYYAFHLHNI